MASSAASPGSGPPLENPALIEAPFLVGMMISCVLLGIACAQTVYYFRTYPRDTRYVKALVTILFVLDFVHQALLVESMYFFFIVLKPLENRPGVLRLSWTYSTSLGIQRLITSIVQVFYAWRIRSIGPKRISRNLVVGIVLLLAFFQFCIGLVLVGRLFAHPAIPNVFEPVREIMYSIELCFAMLTDILITVTLVYYLHKSRVGFGVMENVIDRLIHLTINIGVLTSAISVATFITYYTSRKPPAFAACAEVITKIYVNSLLASLNSRRNIYLSDDEHNTMIFTTIILQESEDSYELSETANSHSNTLNSKIKSQCTSENQLSNPSYNCRIRTRT